MDESDRHVERHVIADLRSAREHAEHLRRRIQSLVERIAESEDSVADVYEESARLRPHAAERLRRRAREARAFAARERAFLRDGHAGWLGAPHDGAAPDVGSAG
ncbi:hypothetical protein [Actinomycetospora straminea]|uniref:Uncharacterized protein n=1 Tax=Actinomycetospora straminea TaxID=663607 RepID=A0ABP9E9X2_9PSEU|nr:hypothetical protein [Actinomycetospora straminea]MDD7931951.1 hypothetical protein [Actinomycetospora straminea]